MNRTSDVQSASPRGRRGLSNRQLVGRLVLVVVAMFGFGYALVPLYDLVCDITGLNGKTGVASNAQAESIGVDESRTVTVEFTGNATRGLPWDFAPLQTRLTLHPGEIATATFRVRNRADRAIVGQAVPSVAPQRAASSFKKTECFCFTQQRLDARETREMTVRFVVERDLPADVATITLSYSFFNATAHAEAADDDEAGSAAAGKGV